MSLFENPGGGLAPIDWIIVALYALGTILLGSYYSRRQTSLEEYFTGGGKMNPTLIGVSLMATSLSSIGYLSIPGEAIAKGPVGLANMLAHPFIFVVVGFMFGLFFFAFFVPFAPPPGRGCRCSLWSGDSRAPRLFWSYLRKGPGHRDRSGELHVDRTGCAGRKSDRGHPHQLRPACLPEKSEGRVSSEQ